MHDLIPHDELDVSLALRARAAESEESVLEAQKFASNSEDP